jgi:O-antigen/teichoic acid export membrane protein
MDKALEMGQASATGSLQLFVGKIVSTVALAVGIIVLQLFIQQSDYGLYTVALVPAATFLLFQDWGIGSAMARNCAKARSQNIAIDLRKIIIVGVSFEIATGLILTFCSLITASFIANSIFSKPQSAILMIVASVTILSSSIIAASQSLFVGFEKMKLNSFVIVLQALIQCALSPLLVLLGYGAMGALLGYTLGSVVACILAISLLYFGIFRKLPIIKTSRSRVIDTLKPMLKYGIPLAISAILYGIVAPFFSFVMATYCSNIMIGNYRVAQNFALLVSIFSATILTTLFPVFSKINPVTEKQLLKSIFASSIKYASILLIPAAMAMMVLSQPLVGTLYHDKWAYAPSFLILSNITALFAVVGSLSLPVILSALGETKMLMKLNLLQLLIAIPLAIILVPTLGINGVIIGALLDGIPGLIIGLYFLKKHYEIQPDLHSSVKIFLSSGIAAIIVFLILTVLVEPSWVKLIIGSILYIGIFLIAAPLVKAINKTDINNMRIMFARAGILYKILNIPLRIIENIIGDSDHQAKTKDH